MSSYTPSPSISDYSKMTETKTKTRSARGLSACVSFLGLRLRGRNEREGMVDGTKAPLGGILWDVGNAINGGKLFKLPLGGREASS